jgi:hypothetical protein
MQWPSPSPAGLGLEAAYEVDGRFGDVAAGRAVIHCGCSPNAGENARSRAGPAGDPLGPLLEPEERTPRNRNPGMPVVSLASCWSVRERTLTVNGGLGRASIRQGCL